MKFFVAFILTALLSFAGCLFFPWWIIAVAAFIVAALIQQHPIASFAAGFLALFVLWAVQSIYIDAQNEHLLSTKVAHILPLGGSYVALILLSAFVGGIVAGMSALTASFLRKRQPASREI
jgi:cbb3-type cytochrome oxidase subunit 1